MGMHEDIVDALAVMNQALKDENDGVTKGDPPIPVDFSQECRTLILAYFEKDRTESEKLLYSDIVVQTAMNMAKIQATNQLRQDLQQAVQEAASLRQQNEGLQGLIDANTRQMERYEAQIAELRAQLENPSDDTVIAELQQQVTDLQARISDAEAMLVGGGGVAGDLLNGITDLFAQRLQLQEALSSANAEIARCEADLQAREQTIGHLEQEILERDELIQTYNAEIETRNQAIQSLQGVVEEKEDQIDELQTLLDDAQAHNGADIDDVVQVLGARFSAGIRKALEEAFDAGDGA